MVTSDWGEGAGAEDEAVNGGGGSDDKYADTADFEDDHGVEDEAAAPFPTTAAEAATDENTNVPRVQSYDIPITYSKYHQTPRVWMMGYANDRCHGPLTGDEMMQDVISNYAHKTVIVEYIYNVHFKK